MNRDEATEYLIDISYKFGNISVEYLTEKDGEKMREAINVLTNEQQTCEDAVSRTAVLDIFADNADAIRPYSTAWEKIRDLPSVNSQRTGHWIRMKAYEKWGCSECNTVFRFTFKEHDYCPKCGCRMVEPQESEEEK